MELRLSDSDYRSHGQRSRSKSLEENSEDESKKRSMDKKSGRHHHHRHHHHRHHHHRHHLDDERNYMQQHSPKFNGKHGEELDKTETEKKDGGHHESRAMVENNDGQIF